MAARNLLLFMTLTIGAVACADTTRDARSPENPPSPAQAARATAVDPPPAAPAALLPPENATVPAAPGSPAVPVAEPPILGVNGAVNAPGAAPANAKTGEDDELAKIGPNQAQLEAEARENAKAAQKERAKWAKAGLEADRKGTQEWSRDHVMKAAARASELMNMSSRIPPAKRGKFNTDMTMFQTRRADALSRINGLSASGADTWKTTKAELDRVINEMDAALQRVEGDF